MKIGGNFDQPYSLQTQAVFLKQLPGLAVVLHELPYNHSTDGAPDRFTQELLDQDAAWDAKRGTKVGCKQRSLHTVCNWLALGCINSRWRRSVSRDATPRWRGEQAFCFDA
jgi:hypothetical protein